MSFASSFSRAAVMMSPARAGHWNLDFLAAIKSMAASTLPARPVSSSRHRCRARIHPCIRIADYLKPDLFAATAIGLARHWPDILYKVYWR